MASVARIEGATCSERAPASLRPEVTHTCPLGMLSPPLILPLGGRCWEVHRGAVSGEPNACQWCSAASVGRTCTLPSCSCWCSGESYPPESLFIFLPKWHTASPALSSFFPSSQKIGTSSFLKIGSFSAVCNYGRVMCQGFPQTHPQAQRLLDGAP